MFKAQRSENNPLLTNIFCADPTSVEYNGRLYGYDTAHIVKLSTSVWKKSRELN